ncbi:MAG: peptidoglycan recognition family protein [bacterium]|nr:peptidoglycan recognition family protein [bacterium]
MQVAEEKKEERRGGAFEVVPLIEDKSRVGQKNHDYSCYLSRQKWDIEEWKSKSKPEAYIWFKSTDTHWWIDWDIDRKPFDMIVIHHSAGNPKTTPEEIDNLQKKTLYEPRYRSESKSPFVKGLPVHSGHVVDGVEKFLGYHHLVYSDGKVTDELSSLKKIDDTWYIDHVGWHAGNWGVNCRSVAICLVGNFTKEEPPEAQLKATAALIMRYRKLNPKTLITPHSDHTKTECPGPTWVMWRKKILPE